MRLKQSTRYLLLGFSIFIASVIITMMIKEPLIEIYEKFTHNKADQPTKFPTGAINLGIKIEPPGTAGLVLDRENSYLQSIQIINNEVKIKDRPLTWLEDSTTLIPPQSYGNKIYFGGWDGAGIVSLKQSQSFPLDVESDHMYKLNLMWFDASEKLFYQSSLIVNAAKLLTQIKLNMPDKTFEHIIVSIHARGTYTLWLANEQFEIQIDREHHAKKVAHNWAEFRQSLPPQQKLDKKEYLAYINNQSRLSYLDEMFVVKDSPNFAYKVIRDDDKTYCGKTNSHGETKRINTGNYPHKLLLYRDKDCPRL